MRTITKLTTLLAVLLMMSTADVNAQGILGKLKQKAENAITKVAGVDSKEKQDNDDDDDGAIAVPKGSDIIQKRKQTTLLWEGGMECAASPLYS